MRQLDKRTRVSRRGFLAGTGAAAVAVGISGGMVLTDPGGAWAMTLTTLKPDTMQTLIKMARDLYPHDRLSDQYYAKAIEPYDALAAKDADLAALLSQGTEKLDGSARRHIGTPYVAVADDDARVALLRAIEGTPFFARVRSDLITGLYNQPEMWTKLGYEGASAEQGGYLNRGFNNIDWLKA
jgi:hypothetical protein